jgi:hypothetical protein
MPGSNDGQDFRATTVVVDLGEKPVSYSEFKELGDRPLRLAGPAQLNH